MNVLAHGPGNDPGLWILVPLTFMVLFWTGVILVLRFFWRQRSGAGTASAQGVLAERYARGEITDAEYAERLAVLRERSS
jgi:putative membrane protein